MIDWVEVKQGLYFDRALANVIDTVVKKTIEGLGSGYVIESNRDNLFKLFEKFKASRIYFKDSNSFAYLPANRVYTDDNCLEKLGVRSTKIGKLLSVLMGCDIDSKLCNFAVSIWREQLNSDKAVALVSKIEILDDPHSAYKKTTETRLHSCMTGRSYPRFYKLISSRNGDRKVKIAILKDNAGFIIGRALVWYNVEVAKIKGVCQKTPLKITVMDRIYSVGDSSDFITIAFKKYAKENGWYHKYYQSTEKNELFVNPEGEQIELALVFQTHYNLFDIKETLKSFPGFPYLDTFNKGAGNCLMNYTPPKKCYVFTSAKGNFGELYICDSCGTVVHYSNKLFNIEDEQFCGKCMLEKGYLVCHRSGYFSKDHSGFLWDFSDSSLISKKRASLLGYILLDKFVTFNSRTYHSCTEKSRVLEIEGLKFDQSDIPDEYKHLCYWSDCYSRWVKIEPCDKMQYFSDGDRSVAFSSF